MSRIFSSIDGGVETGEFAPIDNSEQIKKIYLVFKTHLDLGYTDLAKNIEQKYFKEYFPRAMNTSRQLRESAANERFVWTVGSWLIYEFLDQADVKDRRMMEQAIEAGDIVWHAMPFTCHVELMDPSLMRYGLSLSKKLDERFEKKTISAKMSDVPGLTRAAVPLMVEAGIEFLHIGVNTACPKPQVPDVFRWQDGNSGEIIVMYNENGYGGHAAIPGMDSILYFAHTSDNQCPQEVEDVLNIYSQLHAEFPNASIIVSGMDNYVSELSKIRDSLPIITGELGDTWIHGVGTDPRKVAKFRALSGLRRRWLDKGDFHPSDESYDKFSRKLLCIPEHTWGLSRVVLDDYEAYSKEELAKLRRTEKCIKTEQSWEEQRQYIDEAIQALGQSELAEEAKNVLNELEPRSPSSEGYYGFNSAKPTEAGFFTLQFAPDTGEIIYLADNSGHVWADEEHRLGTFIYEMFSQKDYDGFVKQYITNLEQTYEWSIPCLTKPNMDPDGKLAHSIWKPDKAEFYKKEEQDKVIILEYLKMPEIAVNSYGCPETQTVQIEVSKHKPVIHIQLQWFNKQACRLPEAIWYSFNPIIQMPEKWQMDKMGEKFYFHEVVPYGNRHLHAVQSGVSYVGEEGGITIEPIDSPLVAPGRLSLLDFTQRQPELDKGIHFNLWNNIWNTNFRYWYEEDAKFRFILRIL